MAPHDEPQVEPLHAPASALHAPPTGAPRPTPAPTPTRTAAPYAPTTLGAQLPLPIAAPLPELSAWEADAVEVDEATLDADFAALPALLARASTVAAQWRHRQLMAELHVKRTRAARATTHRALLGARAATDKAVKATVDAVADAVTLDPQVIAAEDAAAYAEAMVAHTRGVLSALARKGDALTTLGANLRQERGFAGSLGATPRPRYPSTAPVPDSAPHSYAAHDGAMRGADPFGMGGGSMGAESLGGVPEHDDALRGLYAEPEVPDGPSTRGRWG